MNTPTFTKAIAAMVLLSATALPVMAQPGRGNLDARLRDQERRVDQGVASGQLTRAEAARLRQRDVNIRFDDRIAHITGGRFTPAERARLEAKLNRTSRDIYHDKHNGRVRP